MRRERKVEYGFWDSVMYMGSCNRFGIFDLQTRTRARDIDKWYCLLDVDDSLTLKCLQYPASPGISLGRYGSQPGLPLRLLIDAFILFVDVDGISLAPRRCPEIF